MANNNVDMELNTGKLGVTDNNTNINYDTGEFSKANNNMDTNLKVDKLNILGRADNNIDIEQNDDELSGE